MTVYELTKELFNLILDGKVDASDKVYLTAGLEEGNIQGPDLLKDLYLDDDNDLRLEG